MEVYNMYTTIYTYDTYVYMICTELYTYITGKWDDVFFPSPKSHWPKASHDIHNAGMMICIEPFKIAWLVTLLGLIPSGWVKIARHGPVEMT